MLALFVAIAGQALAQPTGAPAEVPQAVAASNRDSLWKPTDAQVSSVLAMSKQYFSARDSGKTDEAHGYFSPSQKAMVPLSVWRSSIEAFNGRAGTAGGRTVRKVTWYKDPPQARPGTYAAIDFSSEFSSLALHCGYVMWHEQPDGSFAITREEDNVIDRDVAGKLRPGQLEQIRSQFRC
ncbi:MAG: DUF4019 domain-containing protein [Pseudomonadota bacterium]